MTRKRSIICKENPTKLLFKNSQNSLNTYSKTYSDVSRFCTKSLVMQLTQKLPTTKFYEDQGTLKRDLSIETDICILRRYYKNNRNKLIKRGAVSAKSKYSYNHSEIDTVNEFTRDSSACGDSELTNQKNPKYNINLTSLVVNNLKKLLNDWIKKYLLENNETKQKIDSVLDSILHKLDLQRNDTSSCTYTVDVELENQSSKQDSLSILSQNKKLKPGGFEEITRQKSSYLTIPLSNKYLQIISTLSIPRNQNRNRSKSLHKIKKLRHKKILLSFSKSSKHLLTSSLDFLTIGPTSLTKRFATYQRNEKEIVNKSTVFIQKSYYSNNSLDNSSISEKTVSPKTIHDTNIRNVNSNPVPTIYKNIYSITPGHIISYESTITESKTFCSNITEEQEINIRPSPISKIQQKQKIINENEQSDQLVTIDFGKQSGDISKLNLNSQDKLDGEKLKTSKIRKTETKYRKINLFNRKISRLQTHKNIKSKQLTYLFRKTNNNVKREKELLNHFQSILKYFSNYGRKKDIQLHIQINVCPITSNEEDIATKSCTNLEDSNIRDINTKEKYMKKPTPLNSPNIIPLLDGAASQSKYMESRETSTDLLKETIEKYIKISHNQIINSEIAQEISELRVIIKSLGRTAEKLISDHMCPSGCVNSTPSGYKNDFPVNINLQHPIEKSLIGQKPVAKYSKGNQISNNVPQSPIISGFKLRKEPKNKHFIPRQMKKNTSYNIILSESILKITDMTSAAQNITYEKMTDEALTCSLPKSKSLFEITVGPNKRKLLAFYCDDFVRPAEYTYNICDRCTPCSSNRQREDSHRVKPECVYSKCNHNGCYDDESCPEQPKYICTDYLPVNDNSDLIDDDNSCSSVCIDIDPKICTQKVSIRNRDGVGFWEGCLYCVFLWIPVTIIFLLFYEYVIKALITQNDNLRIDTTRAVRPPNRSIVRSLTLTDLGF